MFCDAPAYHYFPRRVTRPHTIVSHPGLLEVTTTAHCNHLLYSRIIPPPVCRPTKRRLTTVSFAPRAPKSSPELTIRGCGPPPPNYHLACTAGLRLTPTRAAPKVILVEGPTSQIMVFICAPTPLCLGRQWPCCGTVSLLGVKAGKRRALLHQVYR